MKSKRFRQYIGNSIFRHVFARGHHPQTIGMLKRFNQSQKYERICRREYTDPTDAELDLENYRVKYNTYRPHEAEECANIFREKGKEYINMLSLSDCLEKR